MDFENLSSEKERSTPRSGISRKALVWIGALAGVVGAAERAEANPENATKKKEAAETFTYKNTATGVERAEDLAVDNEWRKVLPDGKIVSVYEGEHVGMGDEASANVLKERVLSVHVIDDPDPKVKGDERWVDCQVIFRKWRDEKLGELQGYGYACVDSALLPDGSGLYLDSAAGAFEAFSFKDEEYGDMGAQPKTEADLALRDLNDLYWAVKGLKEVGADKSDLAEFLIDQLKSKAGEAQSHEKTHPINEDAIKELLP